MSMTASITIPICGVRKAKLKRLTEQLTFPNTAVYGLCALRSELHSTPLRDAGAGMETHGPGAGKPLPGVPLHV